MSFQSHFWRVLQRPPFWNVSSTIPHPHLDLRMATQKFLLHHPKMMHRLHTASIWLVSLISLAVWAPVLIQAFLGPNGSPSFACKTFLSLTMIYPNCLPLIKKKSLVLFLGCSFSRLKEEKSPCLWVSRCGKICYSFRTMVIYFKAWSWFFFLTRKQNKEGTKVGGGERMCSK